MKWHSSFETKLMMADYAYLHILPTSALFYSTANYALIVCTSGWMLTALVVLYMHNVNKVESDLWATEEMILK